MTEKTRKVKLKRFGRINENLTSNFKELIWSSKYGNDFDEPKDSSLIVKFSFDKKECPTKEDLPLYMEVLFGVVQKKNAKAKKGVQK